MLYLKYIILNTIIINHVWELLSYSLNIWWLDCIKCGKKCPQIQSTPGGQTNVNGFDFCKNNNQALA